MFRTSQTQPLEKMAITVGPSLIRKIVEFAAMAPSPDNCQPWRFEWDGNTLFVIQIESRARHALNRANHASLLSLGATLEAIEIAALCHGFESHFNLALQNLRGELAACRITFESCNAPRPFHLLNAMAVRCTDRRLYEGGSLKDEVFEKIKEAQSNYFPCSIHFLDRYPKEFVDLVLETGEFLTYHFPSFLDFLGWVRFSARRARKMRDGMLWRNLGIRYHESKVLYLCRNRVIWKILSELVLRRVARESLKAQMESSAALYCISLDKADDEGLVKTGRFAFRIWLELAAAGYGVQPLSFASLLCYDSLTGAGPDNIPRPLRNQILNAPSVLSKAFSLSEGRVPVWMFRTGKKSSLPPKMRTLRRKVEDILLFRPDDAA